MALSPELIKEIRSKAGLSPEIPASSTPQVKNIVSSFNQKVAEKRAAIEAAKPKLGQGAAGEFGAGVVGSLIKTGATIQKGVDQTAGRVVNAALGKGFVPTNTAAIADETADRATQQSDASKVGDFVGTVAQFAGPGGPGKAAVEVGAGLLPKAGAFIARNALEFAKDAAIGTAQTGDAIQGAEIGAGGRVIGALAKPVGALGKGIAKVAIPVSSREAQILQAYNAKVPFQERLAKIVTDTETPPTTAGETAFNKGFWGTEQMIGTQATKAKDTLWKEVIDPALKRSNRQVSLQAFFKEVENNIVKNNPEPSRRNTLLEALEALKEDYAGVDIVDMSTLQKYKEGWAKFIPDKAYKGKPIGAADKEVKDELADLARTEIHEAVGPEASQAYIDYGNLIGLQEWGQKAMTGGKFKGGTGGFLSAAAEAILTPITTIGGQTLYKTAEGVQFIGAPGARYLSELFEDTSSSE